MHWRVSDFYVRKLHLTLRQSDALTGYLCICQKTEFDVETVKCTDGFSMMSERLYPDDQMHWRIDYGLAVSATDVVTRF